MSITEIRVIKYPDGSPGLGIMVETDKLMTESKTGNKTGKLNTARSNPLLPDPIAIADKKENKVAKPKVPKTKVSIKSPLLRTGSPRITDMINHDTKPRISSFNQTENILAK